MKKAIHQFFFDEVHISIRNAINNTSVVIPKAGNYLNNKRKNDRHEILS